MKVEVGVVGGRVGDKCGPLSHPGGAQVSPEGVVVVGLGLYGVRERVMERSKDLHSSATALTLSLALTSTASNMPARNSLLETPKSIPNPAFA